MKINKQLFEDVLLGKLKGTFVLRNKIDIETNNLNRNISNSHYVFPYKIYDRTYTENGLMLKSMLSEWDIIDFIPYTDMKENELTIEIPDGKIVDWDESKKQNKIILKDKQLTYEEICRSLFKNGLVYYTTDHGNIDSINTQYKSDSNNATTAHQLECILAKNKLANVAKYLNDGWDPTNTEDVIYYLIMDWGNRIFVTSCSIHGGYYFSNIVFKSKELAQQAIEILGEETIKLALKPLGI